MGLRGKLANHLETLWDEQESCEKNAQEGEKTFYLRYLENAIRSSDNFSIEIQHCPHKIILHLEESPR